MKSNRTTPSTKSTPTHKVCITKCFTRLKPGLTLSDDDEEKILKFETTNRAYSAHWVLCQEQNCVTMPKKLLF